MDADLGKLRRDLEEAARCDKMSNIVARLTKELSDNIGIMGDGWTFIPYNENVVGMEDYFHIVFRLQKISEKKDVYITYYHGQSWRYGKKNKHYLLVGAGELYANDNKKFDVNCKFIRMSTEKRGDIIMRDIKSRFMPLYDIGHQNALSAIRTYEKNERCANDVQKQLVLHMNRQKINLGTSMYRGERTFTTKDIPHLDTYHGITCSPTGLEFQLKDVSPETFASITKLLKKEDKNV